MLIAIDYDNTFTAARGLWSVFAGNCRVHRIDLICVTRRSPSDPINDPALTCPIIYADSKLKREAAEAAGYHVDIWIDDEPGTIERCRLLEWPAESAEG